MIYIYCNNIISVLSRSPVWHDNEGSKRSNSNVKWSCELQKLKLDAKKKHGEWLNNGSPKVGNIYNDILIAKKLYKNEIKTAKLKERMKKCKFVERLLNEKNARFWKLWRKFKNKKLNVIDYNSNVGIANNLLNNFGSKYVHSKDNKLLFEEYLHKYEIIANEYIVEGKTTNQDMVFSVEEIEKAAKKINTNKAGDRNELKIEHIIHAHPNIYCYIKKLFNLIIKHGHVPVDFKLGVIAPVIKDKR